MTNDNQQDTNETDNRHRKAEHKRYGGKISIKYCGQKDLNREKTFIIGYRNETDQSRICGTEVAGLLVMSTRSNKRSVAETRPRTEGRTER